MSDNVVVVATIPVDPERSDAAIEAMVPFLGMAHAEEGCIRYALHRDNSDPGKLIILEVWRSQADLDTHFVQPYMQDMFKVIGEYATAAAAISFTTPVGVGGKGALA